MSFLYWIYVPKQYNPAKPACVFVCQDGLKYAAPDVFDNLIARKEMPVTIGIFINPGDFSLKPGEQPRKKPDGKRASPANRSKEYDTLSDDYARFLLEEILPEVSKKYNLTKDPEGRCIAGSSSGGICAFTVCWERPNEFRKCFTTVGSFTNIRGGNKYPDLVRNSPKKPIRMFQQDGKKLVGHGGACPGYRTTLLLDPQEKYAFVVMINAGGTSPDLYARQMRNILLKASKEKNMKADSLHLESYSGRYNSQPWSSETIVLPWYGKLAMLGLPNESPHDGMTLMKHVQGDTFRRVRSDDTLGEEITFEKDKTGKVFKLWHHSNSSTKMP